MDLIRSPPLATAAIRDMSVRKADETHLAQTEGRYRGLLEAAPDAMVVVNQNGGIVLLNVQAEKQFGYPRDELLGQPVTNIIPEGFAERLVADDLRSAEDALAQQIGTGIELIGRRKDGSAFPLELMLSPLDSAEGILVTAAIRDISVRKAAERTLAQKIGELNRSNEELGQFAYIASHDLQEPLRMVASYTQLLSRRYKGKLDSDADEFISFAVDGANRMQRLIQDLLTYSRAGTRGDQLIDTSSEDALQQALTNLQGIIEDSGAQVTHDPLPTVLADETQLIQLFQNLVGNAIKYQNAGIPRVHVSAARNTRKEWNFSVKDNGLGIDPKYFEKIFGMFQRLHKREEFAGHPTRGLISPAQFIPVAEDCGLILPIGAWVFREACRQARAWADEGLPVMSMAVNVSAIEFRNENFLQGLSAILSETRLNPESLEIELTESVLMKHAESATSILRSLRERGVQVAIDDFGTGYSSLNYLRKFPLDALKIDQSFIRQISTAGEDTAIVTAVIAMARSLKLRVIAEGVETLEELEFLQSHQCDEAQGFYFSEAVPPEEFARLLRSGIAEPAILAHRSLVMT
jgi:PAS domain S-box-containing protein